MYRFVLQTEEWTTSVSLIISDDGDVNSEDVIATLAYSHTCHADLGSPSTTSNTVETTIKRAAIDGLKIMIAISLAEMSPQPYTTQVAVTREYPPLRAVAA